MYFQINRISSWYKPFFYKIAEDVLKDSKSRVDYIPTRDYYHRHTRAVFWMLPVASIFNSRIYLFLFGWLFPINYHFMKLVLPQWKCMLDFASKSVLIQDFVVSLSKLEESITLSHDLAEVSQQSGVNFFF